MENIYCGDYQIPVKACIYPTAKETWCCDGNSLQAQHKDSLEGFYEAVLFQESLLEPKYENDSVLNKDELPERIYEIITTDNTKQVISMISKVDDTIANKSNSDGSQQQKII